MSALDAATAFLTKAQQTLRQARDEGPTPLGQKMLRKGAGMVDSHDAQAMRAVSGALIP